MLSGETFRLKEFFKVASWLINYMRRIKWFPLKSRIISYNSIFLMNTDKHMPKIGNGFSTENSLCSKLLFLS